MEPDVSEQIAVAGYSNLTDAQGAELVRCAKSFRHFLDYWKFVDTDTGKIRCLGEELWPAQEEFVRVAEEQWWVFFLKARQLGETTIECAFDAWVMRFRPTGQWTDDKGVTHKGASNARVHIFSKREKAAQEFLGRVKFGMERLPDFMHLPVETDTMNEYALDAGPDDLRRAIAYPADNDTARGETCTHAHVDEWAFMGNPAKVWQSVEPSAAGSVHFVTTGQGPQNFTSQFWRRCLSGDATNPRTGERIEPCFIGALERPDRNEAWLKGKKASMEEDAFNQEFPMRWEDALSGGGEFVFRSRDLDACGTDFRGLHPAVAGRKYVKAWDIGRHKDAAVGIVIDVTEDVHDVVAYKRLRGVTYPQIQMEIELTHAEYPGTTVVEKNAAGEAVLENLRIPEHQREGFSTTGASKPRIIQGLKLATQRWEVRWDPIECSQLDSEVRGYQIPDDNVVQDSVITLAIGEEYAGQEHLKAGRFLGRAMRV